MQRLITLISTVAMVLMLCSACGSTDTQESAAVNAEKAEDLIPITVVLDHYPMADTVFMYMAKEQGFFAEAGLDVSFVMPSKLSSTEMIANGFSYFGLCSQLDVVSAREQGLAVKSIGAVLQSPDDLFLTKKGNKIYSPSDLYDKKLGYDGSDLQKAMIASMLYGSYRSFMDVNLTDISDMDLGEIMDNDTVDAMLAGSILYDLPLLEEQNKKPDWLKLENYNIPSYYGEVLIASDDLIASEPDLIRSFLDACARGYEFMNANREEAIRCLIRSQDKDNLPISDSLARTTLYTVIPMMKPEEVSFLDQSDYCWNTVLTWMTRWNLISGNLTVDDVRAIIG